MLTRAYNSADTSGSAFGAKWHSTWHRGLSISTDGSTVTSTRADGRQEIFTLIAGKYVADADVTSVLTPQPTGWTLVTADDTVENYTPAGLLRAVTTRAGLTTSLTYDASNRLVAVTGPFGHRLGFSHDSNNRVSTMSVPDGGSFVYRYDDHGNLRSVTHPDGHQRQYVYENTALPNALTGIIDENGSRFATWSYDALGRATSSQHAAGVELTQLSYSGSGATSVTDARGNSHRYDFMTILGVTKVTALSGALVPNAGGQAFSYDANGFRSSKTDFNGNVTTYVHDLRGNETSRTEASGTALARTIATTWHPTFHLPTSIVEPARTTSFAYDAKGNLLTRTISSPTATRKWSYTYNSSGQPLSATDPRGNVTAYAYDAAGDLVKVTNALGQTTLVGYDADGRPVSIRDPNGLATTLAYNFRGQITSRTVLQRVTTYGYDAVGQLTRVRRPDGSSLALTYDAAHRLVEVMDSLGNHVDYTLDLASNRVAERVYNGSGGLVTTRSYAWDAVNRLSQITGSAGQTTNLGRDGNGNLTHLADPLGTATTEAYDALNRLASVSDPLHGQIQSSYDLMNRLVAVTDPRGLKTLYAYDGLDNTIAVTSPDTGKTASIYDTAGNVVASTDARGKTTTYSYDALNRLVRKTFADGTVTAYTYDAGANAIGRLSSISDAGGTTSWTYDAYGQPTIKQQKVGAVTLTTQCTYDPVTGHLVGMVYPSGLTLAFAYDANGRVSAVNNLASAGIAAGSLLSGIAYQPFGPVASWLAGNGAAYRRSYDHDGRIAGIAMPANAALAYAYDAADRITGITETGLPAKSFGYDALGRLTSYASGTTKQTYGYDAVGNRTASTVVQPPTTNIALTYSYDTASNRLLGIGGSRKEQFSYDATGNLLSHTSPSGDYTYSYDARNRRSQTFVGAIPATDTINGLGQRTAQTQAQFLGNVEYFAYDEAGHLIGSYNAKGGPIQETVWLGDLPVATVMPAGRFFIAPDHLGAPHQITNQAGQVVWLWDHDPFGRGQPSGTLSYNLRFPGQYYDANAGTHYNYFRDYDPNTGRYIESDPIGLKGGKNTYAYALSNPVNNVDRQGLQSVSPAGYPIRPLPITIRPIFNLPVQSVPTEEFELYDNTRELFQDVQELMNATPEEYVALRRECQVGRAEAQEQAQQQIEAWNQRPYCTNSDPTGRFGPGYPAFSNAGPKTTCDLILEPN